MLRSVEHEKFSYQRFSQGLFISRHEKLLGVDTHKAIKKHLGLCQAICILIALKGLDHPIIQTLLTSGHQSPIENHLSDKNLQEFKKSFVFTDKNKNFVELLSLLEKVAIKAHPLEVISPFEKLYRVTSNRLSLASHVKDSKYKQDLLNLSEENTYSINLKMVAEILEKSKDNQYIQLSFMGEPTLKNKFNLKGAHATLIFKSKNKFYFFEPNGGLFISHDLSVICEKIDLSISIIHRRLNIIPLTASIIDLTEFLESYKGPQWISKIQDKTISDDKKIDALEEKDISSFLNEELSTVMQESFYSYTKTIISLESQFEKISALLEFKADPNYICSSYCEKPLDFARYFKSDSIQKLLIEHKATVIDEKKQLLEYEELTKDSHPEQLLEFKTIFETKKYELLTDFFQKTHFTNGNSTFEILVKKVLFQTFHQCIDSKDNSQLKLFIKNIHDENLRKLILDSRDYDGYPALNKLVLRASDEIKMISFLLKQNIDTTLCDPNLNTALLLAAKDSNLPIVKKILQYSIKSIEIEDKFQQNVTALAIERANLNLFTLLIEKGAKLNYLMLEKLIEYLRNEEIALSDFLLFRQIFEEYAVTKGDFSIIFTLKKENLLDKIENKGSRIPFLFSLAVQNGHFDIVKLFINDKLVEIDEKSPFAHVIQSVTSHHLPPITVELLLNMNVNTGPLKTYFTEDMIKNMISHFIKKINEDGWIDISEKIKMFQDVIEQRNSFGKLIAMLNKPVKIHQNRYWGELFKPKKIDPFGAIKLALQAQQTNLRKKKMQ